MAFLFRALDLMKFSWWKTIIDWQSGTYADVFGKMHEDAEPKGDIQFGKCRIMSPNGHSNWGLRATLTQTDDRSSRTFVVNLPLACLCRPWHQCVNSCVCSGIWIEWLGTRVTHQPIHLSLHPKYSVYSRHRVMAWHANNRHGACSVFAR